MTFELSSTWVPVLAAFIPLLVSLATRETAGNRVKALVAIVASASLAAVELVVEGGAVDIGELVATFLTALVTQLVAYLAAWKPLLDVNSVPSVPELLSRTPAVVEATDEPDDLGRYWDI